MTGGRIVTIVQGDCAVSADPDLVYSTILGSCVSICMYDPEAGIGGVNHFLLPEGDGDDREQAKYGAYLIELLINELIKSGAEKSRLVSKVFGGGHLNGMFQDIGALNVAFARHYLANEGIPILSESTGGSQARRLQFVPTTGAARQRIVSVVLDEHVPAKPRANPDRITLF